MQIHYTYNLALICSIGILFFSTYLYTLEHPYWYYPAPLGAWLLFDVLCHY